MKFFIPLLTLASLLSASSYEGCSNTKQKAKIVLSGNIVSNIETDFVEQGNSKSSLNEESVDFSISSYTHVSSNLSLVDIKYKKSGDEVCAYIDSKKQIENINKIFKKVSLYTKDNLPNNIDKKLHKLSLYLDDIKQLNYLMPVFLKNTKEYEKNLKLLNKKEKIFQDLYTDNLVKSEDSIWKSCALTKNEAKKALDKSLFKYQGKKESGGILSFFKTINPMQWFSSKDKPLIELFDEQITYLKQDSKECAIIKKDDLKKITKNMFNDKVIFNKNTLDKNPKLKYKQLNNYIYHINITNSLMALFPNIYKKSDFDKISSYKKFLESTKEITYPQTIKFDIIAGNNIKIKLGDKFVKNQQEVYLKDGAYTYELSAKGKCSINGNFKLKLLNDEVISKDLSSYNYPTLLFISELKPTIVIDGKNIKENIQTTIKKCSGSVRYVATFAGQTQSGDIELAPDETNSIELKFLTSKELAVFNDAKTKKFKTKGGVKFSESLTPIVSKNLIFSVDEKPQNGELTLDEKGSFIYISNDDFQGIDTFSYKIDANGEDSGVKIVQIDVESSKKIPIPQLAKIKETIVEKVKPKEVEKKQVLKEEKVITDDEISKIEERYQKFKIYVESQSLNLEKLKKLQKSYPELFKRLLKEKIAN